MELTDIKIPHALLTELLYIDSSISEVTHSDQSNRGTNLTLQDRRSKT